MVGRTLRVREYLEVYLRVGRQAPFMGSVDLRKLARESLRFYDHFRYLCEKPVGVADKRLLGEPPAGETNEQSDVQSVE